MPVVSTALSTAHRLLHATGQVQDEGYVSEHFFGPRGEVFNSPLDGPGWPAALELREEFTAIRRLCLRHHWLPLSITTFAEDGERTKQPSCRLSPEPASQVYPFLRWARTAVLTGTLSAGSHASSPRTVANALNLLPWR